MATNTNRMKALYAIVMPKSAEKGEADRVAQDVNEERLNDNFRTIANELIKLWEGGEHNLKMLSARISSDEQLYLTTPDALGIVEQAIANNATILMMPDNILSQVTQIINGFLPDGQGGQTLEVAIRSLLSQAPTNITATFTQAISSTDGRVSTLENWVRVYGVGNSLGINPGVIIGDSFSDNSFKAESSCIFFYRGDDSMAQEANADVKLTANGTLEANTAHLESVLMGNLFDFDTVAVNNVEFLHITGRSS